MIRIAITGPESSGKTTLAEQLALQTHGTWIPEYAREFLEQLNRPYTQADLDTIAKGQLYAWENAPVSNLQICDTDMLVMKVWSDFKFGSCSSFILDALNNQTFNHYFLCQPDLEWEEDPLREHPEKRDELYELYLKELTERNLPYTIVGGTQEERIEKCLNVLSKISH
jgi:NadR type nicotinamide-nucleotide adenylyltransferase